MGFTTRGIMSSKDFTRVDMEKSYEVKYWAGVLGISQPQLTEIVNKVGNSVRDIRSEMSLQSAD